MTKHLLRDPKTGRFIAGPDSIRNILPAIAEDFRQISLSILKLTKLDDDERRQRKIDEVRLRRDQYAEKYKKARTSPTRVKKIEKQSSIIDMLKDLFGDIFKFLIISIGVIGLAKLLASKNIVGGIVSFIQNIIIATANIFSKILTGLTALLSDKEIQNSFITLVKSFFSFIGELLSKGFNLFVNLIKDSEVQSSFVNAIKSIFKASYEVIKAGLGIVWSSLNENFSSVVSAISGAITSIAIGIREGIIMAAEIISDPKLIESLRQVVIASFNFVTALLREDYILEGGKQKAGWQIFGEWVLEAAAVTALFLYWKARIFQMSLGTFANACDCNRSVDIDLPDKRKTPKVPDKAEKGIGQRIKEGVQKTGEAVVEAGKKTVGYVKDVAMKAGKWVGDKWESLSNSAKRAYNGLIELGSKVVGKVKGFVQNTGRLLTALTKNERLRKKVISAFTKKFLDKAGAELSKIFARITAKVIATQAAAGAAAATVVGAPIGLVIEIVGGILLAVDVASILYLFYEFLFTGSEEYPNGFYKDVIVNEIEKILKEDEGTSPVQNPAKDMAAPVPFTGLEGSPQKSTQTSGQKNTPGKSKTEVNVPMPASLQTTPTDTQTTSPSQNMSSDYPTNWAASPVNVPAGVAMEKRQVGGLGYGGVRKETEGVVIHHTGGRGLDVAIKTLQNRKLSYHYLIDRDGKVVQILPDNLVGWHAGDTSKKPQFNNSNTISISMVAKDDSDVTPEQVAAASSLESSLAKKYGFPKSNVYGHGELSSQKHPKEGFTIANAIRSGKEEQTITEMAENSLKTVKESVKQNVPPELANKIEEGPGKAIEAISDEVRAAMRMLEDTFLIGRPSFADLSTTIVQNNTISQPDTIKRQRETEVFKYLIERQYA